jgi:hypothetical protein
MKLNEIFLSNIKQTFFFISASNFRKQSQCCGAGRLMCGSGSGSGSGTENSEHLHHKLQRSRKKLDLFEHMKNHQKDIWM